MKHITTDELRNMTNTEGLILQGCGGDPQEWLDDVNELLTQEGILLEGAAFQEAYVFEHDGLTNILFSMEDVKLDVGKLAIWRIASQDTFGGTWLSDYLPNRLGADRDAPQMDITSPAPAPAEESQTPGQASAMNAYIENAGDESIGGFTIPLPTTAEKLRPWLEAIGAEGGADIAVRDVRSSVPGLQKALSGMDELFSLEELNYLATKVSGMKDWQTELFTAALESGRYCGSTKDIINLTENINLFDLQPAFSNEQYGAFQTEMAKDNTSKVFERLRQSGDPEERELAQYILRLETHVDEEAFGRGMVQEENGVFTDRGYLTLRGEWRDVYRGQEDIPQDLRLFATPAPVFLKTEAIDLTDFLAKAHTLGGDFLSDAPRNLRTLEARRSSEYLMLMSDCHIVLTEAAHAYRYESDQFIDFTAATEFLNARAFALHTTDVHQRHVMGHAVEVDVQTLREEILRNCIYPTRIDAVEKSGREVSFTPEQWERLEGIDRDQIQSGTRRFEPGVHNSVFRHLEDIRDQHERSGKAVSTEELLSMMNAAYMGRAKNPQLDMLRIPLVAAREMLVHGDAEVFRLLPEGAKQLTALDAIQSRGGLWYQQYREFAIKKEDIFTLDRWAGRTIEAAVKPEPKRNAEKSRSGEER
jgi:hypothetical protein